MDRTGRFALLTALLAAAVLATGLAGAAFSYKDRIPMLGKLLGPQGEPVLYQGLKSEPDTPDGRYYRNKVLVLMIHDVAPAPADDKALALDKLDRQLTLLRANNFHVISMDEYKRFIRRKGPVPDNAVLLTFDDGYESFYRYAYPLLLKHGVTATNFLIASTIGDARRDGVAKLSWEQVREMKRGGMEFYSHSFNSHAYAPEAALGGGQTALLAGRVFVPRLGRRETEREYERRIASDVRQANAVLREKLGVRNDVLAFPYGAFSQPLLRACRKEGIDVTLTVKPGLNGPGQHNGYRLNAGGADNDPALQIALMKHAEERLGHVRYERPSLIYMLLLLPLVCLLLGALWLRSAWELAVELRLRSRMRRDPM
ncbi:polysaccharide deacetylase family protein [Paenibacillus sp. FSL W8-1187]|uniref:Polysaccharide deacetylase n=1 Tax=Paenibacillus pasadenensis TaxID=217090 RepID=A0A2N5N0A0_9BACL|nr:polysaccharide deacetylase family protein [Paenibacillus pasadenensis]PLT43763.1 Polysaccharide deacetylase [Paenibacillus pasadenensis]